MWKQRAVTLCGSLAVLPLLLGCAQGVGGPAQAYDPATAPAQAYDMPALAAYDALPAASPAVASGARVYAAELGAPAAVLVVLPGPGDMLTENPQLWAAQGFDVVAPPPDRILQLVADQQREAARLIAEAQALARAPVWVVGSAPAVQSALAGLPAGVPGQVSGVVVTSETTGTRTCSERMIYSYSGNGAPQVSVTRSGNACAPGSAIGGATVPNFAPPPARVAPPGPVIRPNRPRVIEAAAPAAETAAARRARVHDLAELIKSPPG